MNFAVTARVSGRSFVYRHVSLLNALDQGMSLVAAGMADVRVADGRGLARTPAELYRHMFGGTGTTGARAVDRAADAAVAA